MADGAIFLSCQVGKDLAVRSRGKCHQALQSTEIEISMVWGWPTCVVTSNISYQPGLSQCVSRASTTRSRHTLEVQVRE